MDEYEEWILNYEVNQESEEYLLMLEKDKEKRDSEKFLLIKEQKILNERKSNIIKTFIINIFKKFYFSFLN